MSNSTDLEKSARMLHSELMAEEHQNDQRIIDKLAKSIEFPDYKSTSEQSVTHFYRESSAEPAGSKHIFSRSASPFDFDYLKFQVPAGSDISLNSIQMNSLLAQAARPARGKPPIPHVGKFRKHRLHNFAAEIENLYLSKQSNFKKSKSVVQFASSVAKTLDSTLTKKTKKITISLVQLRRKLTQMGFKEQVENLQQMCYESEQIEAMKTLLLDLKIRQDRDKYIQAILDDDDHDDDHVDSGLEATMDLDVLASEAASASAVTAPSEICSTSFSQALTGGDASASASAFASAPASASTSAPSEICSTSFSQALTGGDASASASAFASASTSAAALALEQAMPLNTNHNDKYVSSSAPNLKQAKKSSFVGNCDETSSATDLVREWFLYHFRNHIPTSEEMVEKHIEHLNKCTPLQLEKAIKDFEEEFFEQHEEVLDQFRQKFKVSESDQSTNREVWKRRSLKNFGEMKDSEECNKFLLECLESCKAEHQNVFADHMCNVLANDVKHKIFPNGKMTSLHISKPGHAIEAPCGGGHHNTYCQSTMMCGFDNDRDLSVVKDPSTLLYPPWTFVSFQMVNPEKKEVRREDIARSIFMGVVYNVRMVANRAIEDKISNAYDVRYEPHYDIFCMDGSTFTLPGKCLPGAETNFFMKSPRKDSEFEDAESAMVYWKKKKKLVSPMLSKLEERAEQTLKFDVIGSSIQKMAQKIGSDAAKCKIKPVFLALHNDDGPEVETWMDDMDGLRGWTEWMDIHGDYKTLPSDFFHTHKILTIHPFSQQQQPQMATLVQCSKLSFDPPTLDASDFSKTINDFFTYMKPFRKQLLASSPETPSNWTKSITKNGKIRWKKISKDEESKDKDDEESDDSYQPSANEHSDDNADSSSDESEIGTAGSKLMQSVPLRDSSLVEQFNSEFSADHDESIKDKTKKRQVGKESASASGSASAAGTSSSSSKDVLQASSPKPGSASEAKLSCEAGSHVADDSSADEANSHERKKMKKPATQEKTGRPPARGRGRPPNLDKFGNRINPPRKR